MTRRERVLQALQHKETDIVPYQLDLTNDVYKRLVTYYNDPDFLDKVGNHLIDARNESFVNVGPKLDQDMFGVVWDKTQEGDFGIVSDYQLKEASLNCYTFPEPDEPLIRAKCEELSAHKEQFRLYTIGFSLFERAWTLRSMQALLMDFILEPAFVNELLDKIVEYNLKVIDIAAQYDIDAIFFGDDWGQQKGLIMGPQIWRTFIKPRLAVMYSAVKKHGLFVAQHSCGDIHEVFSDLIELGLDIYNTFQPEIYDIEFMKKEYGKDITFYGGISTQTLLSRETPEVVKSETRRLMDILARDGGYICAPTHAIPNDVPTENILAFLEVVTNQ
ncbi:uroporphyrinogen decarboxylase family protein [Moorella naiadis]|uniref:uroporphyrinogen decarboxylase family protein n=1 Tax=Moorella naiadis (nom. illeg.) TaxID=3093670 RepID=UPI003D9CA600